LHNSEADLISTFNNFHLDLTREVGGQQPQVSLARSRRQFVIKRFSVGQNRDVDIAPRNPSSDEYESFEKHSRLFGICPCCLLADFVRRYEEDISLATYANNGLFKHIRRLQRGVRYSSAYHKVNQLPVRLVEHLLFLPYVITDETEWRTSELVRYWECTGESIASLYALSCSPPGNAPTAKLLLVDPDHRLDSKLVAAPTKTAEFNNLISGTPPASYLIIELQHWWLDETNAAETSLSPGGTNGNSSD
jgi:hypothetical protein